MSHGKPNKIETKVTNPKPWSSVKNVKAANSSKVHRAESLDRHRAKIKAGSVAPKATAHYGAHKPSALQIHDSCLET
jgi:hypothetical protein